MPMEIERKFLIDRALWTPQGAGVLMRQGYLSSAKERVVRVRIAGSQAFVTIKGQSEQKYARREFEYVVPVDDAVIMLDELCLRPLLEKTRYTQEIGGHKWEIDVFHGDNDGLIVAEIELSDPSENFERPVWLGAEVSDDPRYYNVNLIAEPFSHWRDAPSS